MLAADADALLCDMAETYGIYDSWGETPLTISKYATFAAGLRSDARIRMVLNDTKIDTETTLLTAIFDVLNWLRWSKTTDAERGINCPKPLLNQLMSEDNGDGVEVSASGRVVFESSDAFEQEFERLRLQKGT